jgi:phospholipase C
MQNFVKQFGRFALLFFAVAVLAGCGGLGKGNGSSTTTPNAVTVTLNLNPATIQTGQLATLTWTSANATSVTITPSVLTEDQTSLPTSGQVTVSPSATTTFVATASGPNGSATTQSTLTVNQVPPTLTLSASPATIQSGGTATLTWDSTNATSISIDNGIGNVAVPSGTQNVSPAATTTYTATARGTGGTTTATATVTVAAPTQLAVTLTASPNTITNGQSSTLTWTSQNANSVTISPGIGTVSASGSMSVSPTSTTTYTATATDVNGNSVSSSATVTFVSGGDFQTKIRHIIFMVQENRSFDDYFGLLGQYKASKGFANDIDGLDLSTSLPALNNGGPVHPYHYQTACVENTTPAWNESHADVDFHASTGTYAMDGFINMTSDQPHQYDPDGTRAMGYYNQDDLPYYYELATQFATSDRFFSSLLAPTVPNRMYLFTATSFGHIRPDTPPPGGWTQPTIFQSLNNAGVLWKYYYQDNSVFLGDFSIWNDPASQGRVRNISEWYSILSQSNADQQLAPVVFIEHATKLALDEHPGSGTNMQKGAADAQQILSALMNSPAWQSSIFILTYDEAGGLYDHVPPYAVPLPDSIPPMLLSTDFNATFNESGMRLPIIVVSPWVKPHFVSHTNRELTSILKLIETRYNLPPLTARDAAADNMLEFFDFSNPAWLTPPPLPAQPTNLPCDASIEAAPGFPQ